MGSLVLKDLGVNPGSASQWLWILNNITLKLFPHL